jgi:hypothetical protein
MAHQQGHFFIPDLQTGKIGVLLEIFKTGSWQFLDTNLTGFSRSRSDWSSFLRSSAFSGGGNTKGDGKGRLSV